MKVLVTGANGYIGTGVVRELLLAGHEVVAHDRDVGALEEAVRGLGAEALSRLDAREGDLFSLEDPYGSLGRPDAVTHLAWRDGFRHSSPAHLRDLPAHAEFIRRMGGSGARKVNVMGSMHEVGFWEGSIGADTPCAPRSLYGIAKNALRQAAFLMAGELGFKLNWLRGYYIVGNAGRGCSVFSKIREAAERGEGSFPFTTGENQYDFIPYGELCRQVAAASAQDEVLGTVECCSGRPERLADRAERFIREEGLAIRLEYGAFPDRPYDSKAVWGDDSRIREIMGRAAPE